MSLSRILVPEERSKCLSIIARAFRSALTVYRLVDGAGGVRPPRESRRTQWYRNLRMSQIKLTKDGNVLLREMVCAP